MSENRNDVDIPKENADSEKTALTIADEVNNTQSAAIVDDGPDLDQSKVKFINGVDAAVDLGKKIDDTAFVGLTKDELMQYAKDPYWVRLRLALLVCFWLAWFGMLAAAIIIIVLAPKCPPRPNLEWWQKSVTYQIYPRTFQDTTNDGVGDLQGIESRLSYLKTDLNVSVVHVNAFYPSSGTDGFDITDYKAVDPKLGTIADFHSLVNAVHRKGMKLVIDFMPNHVSLVHHWFNESRKNNLPDNKYRDYFVWANGSFGDVPNKWVGKFNNTSAWTYDANRDAYYYHTFLDSQPDLNLRNPEVVAELKDVLKFWLDQDVDGFHVPDAQYLVEGPLTGDQAFQPESYELIAQFKEMLAEYTTTTEKYRFISVSAEGTVNQTLPFYAYKDKQGADIVLNTVLTKMGFGGHCDGECIFDLVHTWLGIMPDHKWPSWMLGNHDVSRVATRVGDTMVNAVNLLHLTLPGTPFVYYGQEIGIQDTDNIPNSQRKDIHVPSRDPQRTPMQWSAAKNAGFSNSSANLYLPVNKDYPTRNVKLLMAHGSGNSILDVFQTFTLLRQEPSFQWGVFYDLFRNKDIFSFVRQAEGFDSFLVAINFGTNGAYTDFHQLKPNIVPNEGVIVGHTYNFVTNADEFKVGMKLALDHIYLGSGQGVVFKWNWDQRPKMT